MNANFFKKSRFNVFRDINDEQCGENKNRENLKYFFQLTYKNGVKLSENTSIFNYCEADGGEKKFTILPDLSVWKCVNQLVHSLEGFWKTSDWIMGSG